MAKPPHCPHVASVCPADFIRAHGSISWQLLPNNTSLPGGTARVPGRSLAEDLRGFPSLHTGWPPALLGGQSRSQDLARPPGKVAKEREPRGRLGWGVSCLRRGPWSSPFRDCGVERLLRQPGRWGGGRGRRGGYTEGETPGTSPVFSGSAERGSREAEKKEDEALLGRWGGRRGPCHPLLG